MNIEGLERIRQFLVSFGQTPPDNWTTYQVRTLAHHALQLSDEVERLQTYIMLSMKEPICGVCFTRSWQPCPPDTANCISDNTGGWMVCGYCRLVAEYEKEKNR